MATIIFVLFMLNKQRKRRSRAYCEYTAIVSRPPSRRRRVQEGSRTVIGGEGRPFTQVRPQERIGQLTRFRIEVKGRPAARLRRAIAGPDLIGFFFVQVERTLFLPIQHRGVVTFQIKLRRLIRRKGGYGGIQRL